MKGVQNRHREIGLDALAEIQVRDGETLSQGSGCEAIKRVWFEK